MSRNNPIDIRQDRREWLKTSVGAIGAFADHVYQVLGVRKSRSRPVKTSSSGCMPSMPDMPRPGEGPRIAVSYTPPAGDKKPIDLWLKWPGPPRLRRPHTFAELRAYAFNGRKGEPRLNLTSFRTLLNVIPYLAR